MMTRADTKHPMYFEGILQLRNPTNELVDWVKQEIRKDAKAFVAKEERVKNGIDLYLSSQAYLRALGKKLSQRFQGILKTSRTLHTVSKATGRRLFRVTVLFRLAGLKRGDVVGVAGEKFEIVLLGQNKAQLRNVETGKKIWRKIEELV